ncbi:hypothetical protein BDB00DRAFT_766680 [Zychaea mexicana]|uniref:uncharacterized protein n=1 Tax=Zychaea mexicana TaxID=64656 RepID=UPI0022FEC918|nr:uncharacterized protein BDB00DRAFT_766680 [Zychaea mexicana]KAI9491663.1 hypothetical protein BDB00DRAFT_766680 [Zychaea mexicana]
MHAEPHEKKKIQVLDSALICHIDESALFEEQSESSHKLADMATKEFPKMAFMSRPMQDVFSDDFAKNADFKKVFKAIAGSSDYDYLVQINDQEAMPSSDAERAVKLRELFDGITKNTAKEDLYWHMKMTMLVTLAKKEGCSYIFMADSSTQQAIKMISMTSKGRGYSIPFDIGVENDMTFPDLAILRPMKDMLSKEIGLYNRFMGLEEYVIPPTDFNTGKPAKSSIERLTEEFITTLDRDFPSTVSTISRTASKLTPLNDMDMSKKCAICSM